MVVLGLFALFFILTPYDLLSPVAGYSLAERHGQVDAALDMVQGGNMVRRAAVLVFFLAGLVAHWRSRGKRRRYHIAVALSATAFLLLALVSPLWSDVPGITTRKVVVLFMLATGTWGFACLWDLRTLARIACVMTGLSIAFGLVAEGVLGAFHPMDPAYRFRGLSHPNEMGGLCAVFVISALVIARQFSSQGEKRRSAIMLVVSAVGTVFLLLTKARGALGGATAAIAFLVLSSLDRRVLLLLGSVAAGMLSGLILLLPGLPGQAADLLSLGRPEGGELLTLTGRTDLWQNLLEYAAQRPFLGYGYDSFWVPTRILEIARTQEWIIGSSHSGYVDVLIGLGGIGLALYGVFLASCLWTSLAVRRRTGSVGSLFAIAILIWLYTNMFTEVIWFQTNIPSTIAMMVVGRLAFRESPERAGEWNGRDVN